MNGRLTKSDHLEIWNSLIGSWIWPNMIDSYICIYRATSFWARWPNMIAWLLYRVTSFWVRLRQDRSLVGSPRISHINFALFPISPFHMSSKTLDTPVSWRCDWRRVFCSPSKMFSVAMRSLLQLEISRGVLGLDFGSSAVTLRNDEIDVCFEVLVCRCKWGGTSTCNSRSNFRYIFEWGTHPPSMTLSLIIEMSIDTDRKQPSLTNGFYIVVGLSQFRFPTTLSFCRCFPISRQPWLFVFYFRVVACFYFTLHPWHKTHSLFTFTYCN